MTISEELQKKFNAQHSAYERIMSSEIAGATDPESKKEAVLWVTIEAICGTIDGVLEAALGFNPAAGEFTNKMLAQPAKDYAKSVSEPGLKVNPFFQMNGFDANDLAGAKYTQIYLESRRASAFVGGAFSVIGKAGSSVTQADIAGILQHGNATGSTLMHIAQLQDIARNPRYKNSQTIQDWLKVLIDIKEAKVAARGNELLWSCIPGSLLTSLSATALKAVSQLAFKLCFAKVTLVLAATIHWRAFQEYHFDPDFRFDPADPDGNRLSKADVGIGPASAIFQEIFTRRGVTRFRGTYKVVRLVQEPVGWLALADKLALL